MILDTKADEVASRKAIRSRNDLTAECLSLPQTKGFLNALKAKTTDLALIAEVKRASPSAGMIRDQFEPAEIARAYKAAGAHCLSVLTDEKYFQGHDSFLGLAREASGLPCLRKEFIVDEYQIYESRILGADAILLIVAALSKNQLKEFSDIAGSLGLDVLVEVHDPEEAGIANEIGARLVGVNNRNLATFETDLVTSETLLPLLNADFKLSESALRTRADLDRVKRAGADGVLIGTTFCESTDVETKVREVMGW